MYKQMASVLLLSCACASAMADHGFDPIAAIAPEAVGAQEVKVGDVTGDGRDDVVVLAGGTTYYYNRVILYAQTEGGFAPPVAIDYHPAPASYGAHGNGLALADLDTDGDLDILVAYGDFPGGTLAVLRNDGGSFQLGTISTLDPLHAMKFTDVDGDGHLDLVANSNYGDIAILQGDGAAGFGEATWLPYNAYPSTFQLADMDRDGRQDLVYHSWGQVLVRRNEGSGFSATPRKLLSSDFEDRLLVADLTGDDGMDLVLAHNAWPRYALVVHPQGSDGRFRRKLPLGGWDGNIVDMEAGDLDGDGRPDLLMLANSFDYSLTTSLARADGGFSHPVMHEAGDISRFALGDVNDDGTADVVVLTGYGSVAYLAGRGSPTGTDLAVFLGLNAGAAAVRTENQGTVATAAYELTLRLEARTGSIGAGTVPADCSAYTDWNDSLWASCQMPALAPGAHHERIFFFDIAASTPRNMLLGTARVNYDWPELSLTNNVATKRARVTMPDAP